MLKDVTELTTVTVSVTEIKDYVPEQAPTYATWVQSLPQVYRREFLTDKGTRR